MPNPTQLLPAGLSLVAVLCWGTSDFTGGYASKKSDAFVVTMLAHASGFVLMTGLSLGLHAEFPSLNSRLWALVAGALGGTALAIFYRTLATGNMGIAAPAAAVMAAAIPTGLAMIWQGLPGTVPILGFFLAGLGIWLMSRPVAGSSRPDGLVMALVAGLGFAGFFICIHQTGASSALWSAALSRLGSLVLVTAIVMVRWRFQVRLSDALLGLGAGCLDSTGTMLFIRSQQLGRLDAAVVLSSLYPAVTVLLARLILGEQFTRWKAAGIVAALAAVPLIALQ